MDECTLTSPTGRTRTRTRSDRRSAPHSFLVANIVKLPLQKENPCFQLEEFLLDANEAIVLPGNQSSVGLGGRGLYLYFITLI